MRFLLSLLFCALCASNLLGQSIVLRFQVEFQKQALVLHKNYRVGEDTINIEKLKFYVSHIALYQNEQLVKPIDKAFHLVDLEDNTTLVLDSKINTGLVFNQIKFTLGIDSVTQVSGALGGDLDPTKGMYWTWQSGYINFKLEGTASNCPGRNHHFQYHLGGYQYPFACWQNLALKRSPSNTINIKLPIDEFLAFVQPQKNFEIMSPSIKSLDLSHHLSTLFSAQ
jgi:hypothetical protein